MHPWFCAGLIAAAGAAGGLVNALLSKEGLTPPKNVKGGVWDPGALSTIVMGALAAFTSWAFYGSGAGIDLADPAKQTHLQLSALAGAFLVGVVGAKWIENESARRLLQRTAETAAPIIMPKEKAEAIALSSPSQVLQEFADACQSRAPYSGALSGQAATAK